MFLLYSTQNLTKFLVNDVCRQFYFLCWCVRKAIKAILNLQTLVFIEGALETKKSSLIDSENN